MPNDNILGLRITSTLNQGLSVKQINDDLKILAKHPSLQKLKINISIDDNFIKNLSSFSKNLNTITQHLNQQNSANDKLNNGLRDTTETINKQTKATNDAIAAEKKWQVERERTNSKGTTTSVLGNGINNDKKIQKVNADNTVQFEYTKNQLKDYKALEALDRDHFNAIKTNKKMIEDLEKVHYLALQKNRDIDWKNLQATNKQTEALDKAHYQALKANDDMIVSSRQKTQSLINSAFSGKQSANSNTSGINDAKAVELLNRQYEKVLLNLNTAKASGIQLTETELAGINRRIAALNSLSARQKKQEADQTALASTQLRAQTQVNNLMNTKNFSTTDKEKLAQLLKQLNDLTVSTKNFKGEAAKLTQQITTMGNSAQSASVHANTLGDKLKMAMSNILLYSGIGSVFFGITSGLKEMVQTVIEVDSQMTNLKRVMNEDTNFESMLQSNMDMAEKFGLSLKSINETAIEFGRMGFDESQINSLTKSATLAQNISELTAKESVDAIVASMTNFNIVASDSIKIVDALNAVDNNFATTSKDLAIGLTKTANVGKVFGRSMEGILGDITAVQKSTRETGAVTGNALKSIYSRLTTMDKSEGLLAEAGVKMRDMNGEVKTADQLIKELAANFNNLNRETQGNITVGLAGRHHMSRFTALLQNYNVSVKASEVALNSQGSSMEENSKRIGSLEARIERMKAVWQSFSVAMGDSVISSTIEVVTTLMIGLGKTFTFLAKHIGGLPIIFGVLNTVLFLSSSAFRSLSISLTATIANFIKMPIATAAARAGILGVAFSMNTLKVAARGLLAASVVGVLFVGLGYAAEKLMGHFAKSTEATDELSNSLENLENMSNDLSKLKKLSLDYENLSKKTKLTTDEKAKLQETEVELQDTYGVSLTALNGQTDATDLNIVAIKGRTMALQEEIKAKRESLILDYQTQQVKINKNIEEQGKKVDELREKYQEAQEKKNTFETNRASGKYSNLSNEALNRSGQDLANAIEANKKAFNDANTKLQTDINTKTQSLKSTFAIYIDGLKDSGKEISAQSEALADIYASAMGGTNQDDSNILTNFKKAFEEIQNIDTTNVDELKASFKDLPGVLNLSKVQLEALEATLSGGLVGVLDDMGEGASDGAEKILSLSQAMQLLEGSATATTESMDDFYKSVSKGRDEITLLNEAQVELKKKGHLSISTLQKLTTNFEGFTDVLGGGSKAILEFLVAQEKERDGSIQAQKDKTKALITATYARIQAMQAELAAINSLDSANNADDLNREKISIQNNPALQAAKEYANVLSDQLKILDYIGEDYKEAAKAAKESAKSTDDSTKANKANYDSVSDTVEILTDLQKALLNVDKAQKKLQNSQDRLKEGSKERQESINKEISLLKEQKRLYEEGIKDPSKLVSTKVTTTVKTKSSDSNSTSTSTSTSSPTLTNSQYSELINKYAAKYSVDAKLISAIIKTESNYNTNATSSAGAAGLMQLMPGTAKGLGVKNSYDAEQNIAGGTKHFAGLLKKYNGDVELSLYAYNAGEGNVDKWLKNGKINNIPFAETKAYAPKVLSAYNTTSSPSSSNGVYASKVGGTTVKTDGATDKEKSDAKAAAEATVVTLDSQIYSAYIKSLDNTKAGFEQLITEQENKIEASKKKQETLDPNSVEWRSENNKQINMQGSIQEIKAKEKNQLLWMMNKLGVESADYDAFLAKLDVDVSDIQADKISKVAENLTSQLDDYDSKISDLGHTIDISNAKLDNMVVGSAEYRKEVLSQIPILKKQQDLRLEEKSLVESQLKNEKLTIVSKIELSDRLQQLELDWISNEKAIKNVTSAILALTSELTSSLFDSLSSSLNSEDILNLDEFNDSIDSIISSLDTIDEKYLTGVNFVDSSASTRSDLSDYSSKVKDIANQVKSALTYYQDMSSISFSNMSNLGNQITSQINLAATLKTQLESINNTIRDTELQYSKEESSLENLIKTQEKSYDTQIKNQQDILKGLDDQIEKEDRIKTLQEKNDELNKVKNDKRFEYVTEAGELIRTYDKAKVDELEKQKDDLVKQYEREDVKSAIQSEIDRLQKEKDDTVTILQEKLDKTKGIHQQNLEAMRLYQSNLSSLYDKTVKDTQDKMSQFQEALAKGLEDGTISAAEGSTLLQLVVDGWQASSLTKWDSYIQGVAAKLAQLKALYAEISSVGSDMGSVSSGSVSSLPSGIQDTGVATGSTTSTSPSSANQQAYLDKIQAGSNAGAANWANQYEYLNNLAKSDSKASTWAEAEMKKNGMAKYHTGGTVGEKPLAPNELPAILKLGELVLTKDHVARMKEQINQVSMFTKSLFGAIQNINNVSLPSSSPAVAGETSYTFSGPITVKANNPTEFFQGLQREINSM